MLKPVFAAITLFTLVLGGCAKSPSLPAVSTESSSSARSKHGVEQAVRKYFKVKFERMDLDRSGDVSRAEAVNYGMSPEGFDETDADHDGRLTLQEFGPEYAIASIVASIQQTAAAEFTRMDTNRDHVLSAQEMQNAVGLPMSDCDANRDGLVTLSEFETAMALKSAGLDR